MKKVSTKLWHGLSEGVAQAGAAGVLGMALLPTAFAGQTKDEAQHSAFLGDLDKAISNIFAGEGGEGGAGLSPMWPTITVPALSNADIKKLVTGNTLRTDGHVAWHFTPDGGIEGGYVEWTATKSESCPAKDDPKDAFYRGTDNQCYTYKLYPSKGAWSAKDNQLCVNVTWSTGAKNDCRYVAILLDDIALFDSQGKIDGKGMKLLKGKAIAE
jgi:hypothetical protein